MRVVCIKDVCSEDNPLDVWCTRGTLYHTRKDNNREYIYSPIDGDSNVLQRHYIYDSDDVDICEFFFEYFQIIKEEVV